MLTPVGSAMLIVGCILLYALQSEGKGLLPRLNVSEGLGYLLRVVSMLLLAIGLMLAVKGLVAA